jgi:formate hydrogenlyase transcriptional activator
LRVPTADLVARNAAPSVPARPATLVETEREAIRRALDESRWMIGGAAGAAARLGMKRTTLQSRIRKLGIQRPNA